MCEFSNKIGIPKEQFCNFITVLKSKYNKNSNTFHNFLHGITGITQQSFYFSDAWLFRVTEKHQDNLVVVRT